MKNKIILIILMVFLFGKLPVFAKVSITDVEYLKGVDFVQLHFKTDAIIPIPDLFYPIQNNFKYIVMRIENVKFAPSSDSFSFESPVVKNIGVKKNKSGVDVEIYLKEKVNYRVFSNRNGLYIEFPKVKLVKKESVKPIKKSLPSVNAPKIVKKDSSVSNVIYRGSGFLKGISAKKISDKMVKINIKLSSPLNYAVNPIENKPARLAIDFKNLKSKRVKKNISMLNVKGVRGAYNSPDVYRVVFDLDYLKKFKVGYSGNNLVVEFGEDGMGLSGIAHPKLTKSLRKKPEKIIKINSKPDFIVLKGKTLREKIKNIPAYVKSNNNGNISDLNPSRNIKIKSKPGFFSEEKSKAENKELKGFVQYKDKDGTKQISYLKNTIDEARKEYTGIPMDFSFKNADLTNVLKFIAQVSNLNIVVDPGVTGRINAELKQVPWDQALELFLKINKLDMVLEGNILRIGKVDSLAKEASMRRKLQEAREMDGKLEVTTRKLSYSKASDIKSVLSKQLSQRGEIIVDTRTNLLIISDIPDKIKIIDKLIDTLDAPNPQVSIEAKIVETSTKFIKSLGIQWGTNMFADAAHGNQTNLQFPNNVQVYGDSITNILNPGLPSNLPGGGYAINIPASGAPTAGALFSFGNVAGTFKLNMALTAMENQGKGRIISAPKITTQDNLKAKIVQGARLPIQTIQNNTVTVKYENAALELEVTPHITAKGTIVMEVKIKNDYPDWTNVVNNNPAIATQEVQNTVMSADGGTIVIGGVFKVEDSSSSDKVPFLSKIPILGSLFKNSNKTRNQKELLVFLTPRIVR